jgi:hypothetical protein
MNAWWLRPWVLALGAGVAVLALALLPPLWQAWRAAQGGAPVAVAPPPAHGLPWQVEALPGGAIRVFGLTPGVSVLADADPRGDALQLALVARGDEVGVLEAYVEQFRAGHLAGRLVLAAAAGEAERAGWRTRSTGRDGGREGVWRHRLAPADRAQALRAPITGLTFIPAAQLDAPTLVQRFGEPAGRVRTGERLEHWLYPDRGLAITLDTEGREVLQYVAPAEFEARLHAPLRAAAR